MRLSYTDGNGDGQIRVEDDEIIEENNYYPFGLKHKGYNTAVFPLGNSVANKWKYNGVELEEGLGVDIYEMDWRQYYASLGRFTAIDPLAEDAFGFTPYRFGLDNPIIFSDPTGLFEEIDGGYTTDRRDEIERLLTYVQNSGGDITIDDINNFIEEDIAFTKEMGDTFKLSGLKVVGERGNRSATDFSIHKTKNEIAYYLGYTDYLYTESDYHLRNDVIQVSSGPSDGILRTILYREEIGFYQPITAGNYIDYAGGELNARLATFSSFLDAISSLDDGGSAGSFRLPRSYRRAKASDIRANINLPGVGKNTVLYYKGMSFKDFHMTNSHLYKGKFRGRGTYMTHMSMDWRRYTLGNN